MLQTVAALGAVVVSAMGAVFGLYQARKADRSATTTRTIELGVNELVNQYRETNEELRAEVHALQTELATTNERVKDLERQVENFRAIVDEKDVEILRLKHELGEPIT